VNRSPEQPVQEDTHRGVPTLRELPENDGRLVVARIKRRGGAYTADDDQVTELLVSPYRESVLRDRDEVQHELLGEDTAVVEPCVGEALVAEALDRIGEDTDPDVVVEVAQMAVRVE